MKKIYSTPKIFDILKGMPSVCLFILVFGSSALSQDILVKAELISTAKLNRFRSGDDGVTHSSAQNLYILYGNDFEGPSDFYLEFNLKNRQTVRYELVGITGKLIGLGEIPDVLDQTYKVGVQVNSSGIYIVRLMIDSKYYSEKVYCK